MKYDTALSQWKQASDRVFFLKIFKFYLAQMAQTSKFDLIWPRNHVLACCSDPAGPIWTKIGTVKQLDPGNKPVTAFLQNLQI